MDSNNILSIYFDAIRESLLNGKSFEIHGIGTLVPYVRKVKNDNGRDYALKVKLVQSYKFKEDIVKSYENDSTKFKKG